MVKLSPVDRRIQHGAAALDAPGYVSILIMARLILGISSSIRQLSPASFDSQISPSDIPAITWFGSGPVTSAYGMALMAGGRPPDSSSEVAAPLQR